VIAEEGGTVVEFRVAEGAAISEGDVVAILEG
jgi:biotin carboxyl carrier protein